MKDDIVVVRRKALISLLRYCEIESIEKFSKLLGVSRMAIYSNLKTINPHNCTIENYYNVLKKYYDGDLNQLKRFIVWVFLKPEWLLRNLEQKS